jgi:hypothetical protein
LRRLTLVILVLTTAGLALVLSSCGSSITPLSASSAPSIISLQQSSDAQMLDMLAPSTSYKPMALSSQQLTKSGLQPQVVTLACVAGYTWGANSDGDLAPADGTITYGDCSGTTITSSGTFTIADTNDNDAYSGFNAALNNFDLNAPGVGVTLSINGTVDVLRTSVPPSPNYDLNYSLDIAITVPGLSGTANMSGTPTFASNVTGTTDPWVSGTFTFNGTATFVTSNGYHYSLTRTGTGVYDTSACLGAFTGGSLITYTDSQGNKLVIGYSGCDTGSWMYTASSGGGSTGTF